MYVPNGRARVVALAVAFACALTGALPGSAWADLAAASCRPSPDSAAQRLERSAIANHRVARRFARRAAANRRLARHRRATQLSRSSRRRAERAKILRRRAQICATAALRKPPRKPVDRTAPSVAFRQPVAGAVVAGAIGGSACEAAASDQGGVVSVEFSVDGTPLTADHETPYQCSFDSTQVANGAHTLEARAVDAAGNAAVARVSVDVRNILAPAPTEPAPDPPPGPAAPAAIGVEGGIRYRSGTDLVNTVGRLRAAGLGYTREAIAWYRVEPTRGNFTWTETDRWVGEAARRGLRVVAILHQPPQWATGSTDRQVAPVEGQPLADYARYVRAVVERYGSTGSFWSQNPLIPKVPITHWNIWNEPYMTFSWHNAGAHAFPDPAGYARMFRAAVVEGRRAGDPSARFMAETEVEAGTTDWSNPRYYLSKMFEAVPDLAQYMDIASIHPYVGTNPARPPSQCATETSDIANRFNFCRIKTIRSILNRHGATETGMWITEMGYSTCPSCTKWKVSEDTQAFYVREVFRLLRESRLVDGMIWWVYKTGESDPTHAEDWMGLVRADGSAKPAWNAFSDELKLGL